MLWFVDGEEGVVYGVRLIAHGFTLQEHADFTECGPLGLLPVPTFAHEVVDLFGAARGLIRAQGCVLRTVVHSTIIDDIRICQGV